MDEMDSWGAIVTEVSWPAVAYTVFVCAKLCEGRAESNAAARREEQKIVLAVLIMYKYRDFQQFVSKKLKVCTTSENFYA